jgi:hypothetical protein
MVLIGAESDDFVEIKIGAKITKHVEAIKTPEVSPIDVGFGRKKQLLN